MRIIYTIILLVLLAITFSKAQWKTTVEESNIISSAPGTQNYPSLALDRKGEFFVAWTDARNSSTGNDIYIQRLIVLAIHILPKMVFLFVTQTGISNIHGQLVRLIAA